MWSCQVGHQGCGGGGGQMDSALPPFRYEHKGYLGQAISIYGVAGAGLDAKRVVIEASVLWAP